MKTLLIILIVAGILFFFSVLFYSLYRLIMLRRRAYEKRFREYRTVSAGNPEDGEPELTKSLSTSGNVFCDEQGIPLHTQDYDTYVVRGESMTLCGIHDRDIIFVRKGFSSSTLPDVTFPEAFVIRRHMVKPGEPLYKLRRTWRTFLPGKEDAQKAVREIMESGSFRRVCDEKVYPGDKEMSHDFREKRLPQYCKEIPDNPPAVISTTLKQGRLHFSIHPQASLMGKVAHAYTVNL